MCPNAQSLVCVGEDNSKEFEVMVEVHQGSLLSPLLFIIVLEALVLLGRTYMQIILSSMLTPKRNLSGGS